MEMSDTAESKAARMAEAIEKAMPRIVEMWEAFPYAEQPGDDEAMTELRQAAKAWRTYEYEMM